MADPAALLDEAALNAKAIPQLDLETVDEGYAVQETLLARRWARGERLVGYKMGLTSKAKMAQVGVNEVIFGRLTDAMQVPDGGSVDVARFIHPRVEPEVAFLLRDGDIVAVAAALELIDSRYADFKFTLPDVIADNTSGAAFTVGAWHPVPVGIDNLGVLLEIDGKVVQVGSTAAILGDPRRAWRDGVALAARHGVEMSDGILLAGAATAAVPLAPGAHVRTVVQSLGTASLRALP
ncbi:4-oxalocrotonate decarboxylase [Rhizocola hellebori]|uniref:4-oxalocrotonate decarboxylase n=1 Tax=Rhizocola hellebori TaxID=1392758 RepID=A0A8J3VKP9_9ACTN|nr:4-oxalocrotonate decarboxylase [Rhizocola hellebori]GIH09283.1 4-oxalocrotonate decarboxylase [Rhizocola hellebori]